MALFAQSLNTLKKRATNLANELVKGEDGRKRADLGQPSAEAQRVIRGLLADGEQDGAPLIVRYEVQNGDGGEREMSAFPLPAAPSAASLGHVRRHFPVPGSYHFRFKAHSIDSAFGGHVWLDLANDAEVVPLYRGDVCMKALRLPDESDAPLFYESVPNSTLAAAALASASAPCPQAASPEISRGSTPAPMSPGSTPPRAASPGVASPEHPSPRQQHTVQPAPQQPQPAPPQQAQPPVAPGPASDLMDLGAPRAEPTPPSPPVALDRERLRAEREAWEKQQVLDAAAREAERVRKEAELKAQKVVVGNRLEPEITAWAKMSDGQSYKDVKVLLSTLHTVVWPGCQWSELPLSELMSGSGTVKKNYFKAILLFHPDKQGDEADVEQLVRAERIFHALNEAHKISER